MIAALNWHVLQPQGKLSESIWRMTGKRMSDGSLSERRRAMGVAPWKDAADKTLKAMRRYGGGNYKGYRLVGVDGTTFNVCNSPSMKKSADKTGYPRGESAFYRIPCVSLCDLATHSALAVQVGLEDEAESPLAREVLKSLEERDLLVGDRYYGNGKCVGYLLALAARPAFLLRVNKRNRFIEEKRLNDGSRTGSVPNPAGDGMLNVREIQGKVRRPGNAWTEVRFWTNLMDAKTCPAKELLCLYAWRWEHEIAFREIKACIKKSTLLNSQTTITAAQEIYALFMGQSVVAAIRQEAGEKKKTPPLQISFQKALEACINACTILRAADRFVSDHVMDQILFTLEREIEWNTTNKRRCRSCPRMVRKPINSWPCLKDNSYTKGSIEAQVNV